MAMVCVRLRVGEQLYPLSSGGLIGRSERAELSIDDPSVSEFHAALSQRGSGLWLLALRGPLIEDGEAQDRIWLRPGVAFSLSSRVHLKVDWVAAPNPPLAVLVNGRSPRELCAELYALAPSGELTTQWSEQAVAVLTWSAERWVLHSDGKQQELRPGSQLQVGGHHLYFLTLDPEQLGTGMTTVGSRLLDVHADFDRVRVSRKGQLDLVFNGKRARLLYELAAAGCAMEWETLAREIWKEDVDHVTLQKRLHRVLGGLRARLADEGIRQNLVQAKGGLFELVLGLGDEVLVVG